MPSERPLSSQFSLEKTVMNKQMMHKLVKPLAEIMIYFAVGVGDEN
jgi:hypothetical protein